MSNETVGDRFGLCLPHLFALRGPEVLLLVDVFAGYLSKQLGQVERFFLCDYLVIRLRYPVIG